VSIHGNLSFVQPQGSKLENEQMLSWITTLMQRAKATEIREEGKSIYFSAPLLRGVLSTNVLSTIDGGVITPIIENKRLVIRYKLGFWRSILFSLAIMAIFFLTYNQVQLSKPRVCLEMACAGAYMWEIPLLLGGVFLLLSYAWTAIYFPMWLRSGIKRNLENSVN
jgi:hypothetical protein